MADLKLLDVSEFQAGSSAPDWAGIKRQNGGAGICRVGYGHAHLDHMFVSNYTAMKANKFSFIGLYQYIVAGQDITAQARAFCAWIGPATALAPGTVLIADLEEGSGNQLPRANTWFGVVDRFYGLDRLPLPQRSWLYAGASFAADHGLAPVFASQRHTWVAAYSNHEPGIGHTLWQSTDGQAGSNITAWAGCGRIDTSVYHGTLAQLAATGWKGQHPVPPAKPAPAPHPTLQQGDTGPAVKQMQQRLNAHGAKLTADGDFGPATAKAVKAFQKTQRLTIDAVCGPVTWARLEVHK